MNAADSHADPSPPGPGALQPGQCGHCQATNDVSDNFCQSCGASLRQACPECGGTVPAWAKFCGKCGTDISATLAQRTEQLDQQCLEVESLRGKNEFAQAEQLLTSIIQLQHPAFATYREWAERTLPGLHAQQHGAEKQRDHLLADAQLSFTQCRYNAVLKMLAPIPETMRNDAVEKLLATTRQSLNELRELGESLPQAMREQRFDDARELLDRYLILKPEDAKANQLLERLDKRDQIRREAHENELSDESAFANEELGLTPIEDESAGLVPLAEAADGLMHLDEHVAGLVRLPTNGSGLTPIGPTAGLVPISDAAAGLTPIDDAPAGLAAMPSVVNGLTPMGPAASSGLTPIPPPRTKKRRFDPYRPMTIPTYAKPPLRQQRVGGLASIPARLYWIGWVVVPLLVWFSLSGDESRRATRASSPSPTTDSRPGDAARPPSTAESTAASAATDGPRAMTDLTPLPPLPESQRHAPRPLAEIQSFASAPNGSLLVTGHGNQDVMVAKPSAPNSRRRLAKMPARITTLGCDDAGQILVACEDRILRLYDADSGRRRKDISLENAIVRSVAFAADGQRVLSGGDDRVVRLWNLSDDSRSITMTGHRARINDVAFCDAERKAVSCADDGTVRLWDLSTGRQIRSLEMDDRQVLGVAVSPDAQLVAAACGDCVCIVSVDSDQRIHMLRGHQSWVSDIVFFPAGNHLLTVGRDGAAVVWDVSTGREIRRIHGNSGLIVGACVLLDEQGWRVLTCSDRGAVEVHVLPRQLAAAVEPDTPSSIDE